MVGLNELTVNICILMLLMILVIRQMMNFRISYPSYDHNVTIQFAGHAIGFMLIFYPIAVKIKSIQACWGVIWFDMNWLILPADSVWMLMAISPSLLDFTFKGFAPFLSSGTWQIFFKRPFEQFTAFIHLVWNQYLLETNVYILITYLNILHFPQDRLW